MIGWLISNRFVFVVVHFILHSSVVKNSIPFVFYFCTVHSESIQTPSYFVMLQSC